MRQFDFIRYALAAAFFSLASAASTASICFPAKKIAAQLGPMLSADAEIYIPNQPDFFDASMRWSKFAAPSYAAYVKVASEEDVQAVVRYANKKDIPFLTVSGGHGWTSQLQKMQHGIGISTQKLNTMKLSKDGKTVSLGGGVKSGQVERFLSAQGKRSVTGVCECTGLMGVALGGGHGTLQGHYGLLADQIVAARIVLGSGKGVTASKKKNSDLFWALQGAGHNFGIVTEVTYKVYDAPAKDNWLIKTFIYLPDQIGAFYEVANKVIGAGYGVDRQPAGMLVASLYTIVPDINPNTPVLLFLMVYDGSEKEVAPHAKPYLNLKPIFNSTQEISYSEISAIFAFDDNSVACKKGIRTQGYSLNLQKYHVPTQRAVYDEFSKFITNNPDFKRSYVIFEGYPLQGVRAIDASTTAVADRESNIIALFSLLYSSPENDIIATKIGAKVRGLLHKGTGERDMSVYIGYARGTEAARQVYGNDGARLRKLKGLKQKYDPHGRFNFYARIE
ncbi:hypothetical protein LCI18_006356 [Fusarium solani-melongenae]|uniref:Uncharacterized protein n=1 Tax=Fusarium solani subsp. cucurbitae TaxID=2747967 RepID=A0ACD3Z3K4_FUSSC|nr:hypothetical protein LCI18_006356 [Fusarium solani-melongenae]